MSAAAVAGRDSRYVTGAGGGGGGGGGAPNRRRHCPHHFAPTGLRPPQSGHRTAPDPAPVPCPLVWMPIKSASLIVLPWAAPASGHARYVHRQLAGTT